MWNWISAIGVTIEFAGFALLAWDLWKTTNQEVLEAAQLSRERVDFKTLVVEEDDVDPRRYVDGGAPPNQGGGRFEGGILDLLLGQRREDILKIYAKLAVIRVGVSISAVGAALQVVGSFGQALHPN
jgi:hypothetical protein